MMEIESVQFPIVLGFFEFLFLLPSHQGSLCHARGPSITPGASLRLQLDNFALLTLFSMPTRERPSLFVLERLVRAVAF